MRPSQLFALSCWVLALCMISVCVWAKQAGYRINRTASMPLGLYKASFTETSLKHGDIVTFCPLKTPVFETAFQRGYIAKGSCPNNREGLLKPVAAIPGDNVTLDEKGVSINGKLVQNTKPLHYDSLHRKMNPLKYGVYPVKQGEIWLISNYSSRSFDSRYFGPIRINAVQGIVQPILTWDKLPQRKGGLHEFQFNPNSHNL